MDARLQLRVQRYGWDAAATHYDKDWRDNLQAPQEAVLEASDLKPGQKVIETAAGSGLVTLPAARAVQPGGAVLATDLSSEMVAQGQAAAEAQGLSHVRFERMNCEKLDLPDGGYDRALCALGLMYVPDPLAALSEMRRVLKRGGKMATAIWGERRNCGWAELFPIVDARVQSEVCPMFFGQGAKGALKSDMERAGFRDVETRRLTVQLRFESRAPLLSAMLDGGPVAMAAKRFDAETRAEVEEEFLASVATYQTGDGYEIPGEFVIASGSV